MKNRACNTGAEKAFLRWDKMELPGELRAQLDEIKGSEEMIMDAFGSDLGFGTAGLRGIMAPGTNKMNVYVVRKSTQGLCDYINSVCDGQSAVVIGYDSRNNSRLFAVNAAEVLYNNGIDAYIFDDITPVAEVSYAIGRLRAAAGIMITASHNSKEYNGFKVYNSDGHQITDRQAEDIQDCISKVDVFSGVKGEIATDESVIPPGVKTVPEDVCEGYIEEILSQKPADENTGALKVVYTPLNGAGRVPVLRVLSETGFDTAVVGCQEMADGDFTTCPYPNPEMPDVFDEALKVCRDVSGDIMIATDPDCDRVGAAIIRDGKLRLFSGNEISILLFDYICRKRAEKGSLPDGAVAVSSIVTSPITDRIAEKYGVEMRRTLIGFKYIGEIIAELEKKGEEEKFIFGAEESKGYLFDGFARDKDGVSASMMICMMAADCKEKGLDLEDALCEIYSSYGFEESRTISAEYAGFGGAEEMAEVMKSFRSLPEGECLGFRTVGMKDYRDAELPADILSYDFENGSSLIIRPSGTEPKIKYYMFAEGKDQPEAEDKINRIEAAVRQQG